MAVCKLPNYDGQLGWKLFGSWGTPDGALEDATLQVRHRVVRGAFARVARVDAAPRRRRSTQVAANLCHCAKDPAQLFDGTTPKALVRGTLLSLQHKSVDWQPWQSGDLRKGRLSAYQVARPPGVHVALLSNGSVSIMANCGVGDVRPCDSIPEAAELAAEHNQAVRDQIVADKRLKELMRESLDVIGETDARLDAADKAVAAAAAGAGAVATVRRAEEADGHGGRKIFRDALALVQRSCDVASSQFSVAGLGLRAALPAADKTQGALLLGSHVHAPPRLRRKVHNIYERVAEEHGWGGVAPFLEELNKAANAEDLLVDVFDTMGLDIRPHRELVQKWYAIGSMTMGSVLESSLVVAPKTSATPGRSQATLESDSTSTPSTRRC